MANFQQTPPALGNQYEDDRVLRSYLERVLPADMLGEIEDSLSEMGRLAGGELYEMQLADSLNEPTLTQWDAWGNRIDRIELTPLWRMAERIAAEHGVVATAYEQKHGSLSRVHQCALAYLFTPSTDIYSCPLAMTDGAARTLIASGNQELIDRAVPHLITRDPKEFWTAGQWMTEITGGSDVGLVRDDRKEDRCEWLSTLWAQMVYVGNLIADRVDARASGGQSAGRARSCAFLHRNARRTWTAAQHRDQSAQRQTRHTQSSDSRVDVNGTPAQLVKGTTDGVRNITPLLNITRLWNGISAVALMRRGLALASDYARKRFAFGAPLSEKPLHLDTLFGLHAESEAAFHFAFYVAELTGRSETGEISEDDARLLRLLTPVMKLSTGKQAVMVSSEVLESFGGAGYVEDTGLPVLLRDSQVLPIWEGTTNVLALDALRALENRTKGLQRFRSAVSRRLSNVRDDRLARPIQTVQSALDHAEAWLSKAETVGQPALEAGARRFAMTLARTMQLALLIEHAQWSMDHEHDEQSASAARRYAAAGVDIIVDEF